jgi:saccharopine dehydrogenase (NAD+, L-lysine-forming)
VGTRALIYGCTGHTGRLIVERARAFQRDIVLAGRDAGRIRPLAQSLGLPWRCASLEDSDGLDRMLEDVAVVLHAAGPFSATARPMLEACLRAGAHYLDIAGELPVFQTISRYDQDARDRGIMLMPGVGFSIVATDCIAAHVTACMPAARHLRLGLSMPQSLSRGSLRTLLGWVRGQVAVCRNGKMTTVAIGRLERSFDYGEGDRWSTCVNWPDTFTAPVTTAIPNVEVYIEADLLARSMYQIGGFLAAPLQLGAVQTLLNSGLSISPSAPLGGKQPPQVIVAEAEDNWRQCARVRLTTLDGYRFTALSAVEILGRVLAGEFQPGFQTPSRVYGADLVLAFDGTTREDLSTRNSDRSSVPTRPAWR